MTDHEHLPLHQTEPIAPPSHAEGPRRRLGWILGGAAIAGIAFQAVVVAAAVSLLATAFLPASAAGAELHEPDFPLDGRVVKLPEASMELHGLPVTLDWDVEIGRPADAYTVKVFSPPGWAIVDETILGVQGQEEAETGCRLWVQQGELPDEVEGIADDREATLAYLGWVSGSEVNTADVEEDVFTAFPQNSETEVPESEQYASSYWLRVGSGDREGFVKARVFAELEQVVVVSALCPAGTEDLEPIRFQAWSHVGVLLMEKQELAAGDVGGSS